MHPIVNPDALDRVCNNLCLRHGKLELLPPNLSTGSVTIIAEDGAMFRFTTQERLIALGRGERRTHTPIVTS